jgi:peptide/nickel transport system ATP-binding protein
VTAPAAILRAVGLSRSFPARGRPAHAALSDVTFDLAPGEVLGVAGPSGSGKSTLARLLVALDRPTSGTVTFSGVDLFRANARGLRRLRSRFQLVFQDALGSADPRWTARQTLDEALEVGMPGMRLADLLARVRLDPSVLGRRPHALSGGERQRVALARALAIDPEMLILDEPFTGLDTVTRKDVLAALLAWRAARGAAIVLISHDQRLVASMADRVLVLAKGRVKALGPPKEVLPQG